MTSTLANRKTHVAPAPDLGPDNVFADFGLADADERALKATLVSRIRAVVADRKLTQVKAGEIMGLPQPKVSELVSGGATGFSAERLIRLLNSLGVSVSIALREEPNWEAGTTFVHFDREPDADMVAPEREQSDEEGQVAQHALSM
jgi:predicted XRE-type DNA-binding protein